MPTTRYSQNMDPLDTSGGDKDRLSAIYEIIPIWPILVDFECTPVL